MDNLSPPEKPKKPCKFAKLLCEDGLTKDSSHPLGHPEAQGCTTSNNSLTKKATANKQKQKKNKGYVIAECHPEDKMMTSKDKSPICNNDSLNTTSSLTSDQESISREKDSEPFWSSLAKDLCPKLWLPIETDSVGSPSNSSSGSFKSMESNSWFSMKAWIPLNNQNSQKTSLPSLTFSIVESMVKESTPKRSQRTNKMRKSDKDVANCVRRIRLYPKKEVSNKLKKWFGCVRKTYNWSLSSMKEDQTINKLSIPDLRKRFVNADSIPDDMKYLLETPKHVRDGALEDLVTAFKSNLTKRKENPEHKFEIKFRSRKDNQAITIPHEAVRLILEKKEIKMYPTFLQNVIKFKLRKRDVEHDKNVRTIDYTSKLVLDKLGRFYLCIPQSVNACENQASFKVPWVSLDPGIRTFQTLYSPKKGISYKLGTNDISRIYRLCLHLDKLISKRKKKAEHRLRKRIKNLIDEVHWKTISFVLSNFQNIIIPPFEVKNMVNRCTRKITKKSVRQMLGWKHYTFRKRLLDKSAQTCNKVIVAGEEYTTKTCTNCLVMNHKIGGNKMFVCPNCKVKVDRDVVGSRNIFLKNVQQRR